MSRTLPKPVRVALPAAALLTALVAVPAAAHGSGGAPAHLAGPIKLSYVQPDGGR